MSRLMIAVVLGTVTLGGCAGTSLPRGWKRGSSWVLSNVELDRAALQSPELRFPIFDPPGDTAFGQVPTAQGTLGVSQEGRVYVQVSLHEPVGAGHEKSYVALDFNGWLGDDRASIVNPGLRADALRASKPTRLMLSQTSSGSLRIQGVHGTQKHPYVFTFSPRPARAQRIPVPHR